MFVVEAAAVAGKAAGCSGKF